MARRGQHAQEGHDAAVERIAQQHREEGWRVWADVSGFPTPRTIRGRRPDVLCRDSGATLVIEVETDTDDDTAQHEKFRAEAEAESNTTFVGYLVDYHGEVTERFR